jgi:hypothetical protein
VFNVGYASGAPSSGIRAVMDHPKQAGVLQAEIRRLRRGAQGAHHPFDEPGSLSFRATGRHLMIMKDILEEGHLTYV